MNYFILLMTFVIRIEWNTCDAFKIAELGTIPCFYVSNDKNDLDNCLPSMNPNDLPTICTSLIFDTRLFIDAQSKNSLKPNDNTNVMNLLGIDKPVYFYMGYNEQQCLPDAFDNSDTEIKNIQDLAYNYNISGIILMNTNLNSNINCDDKLKNYFDKVKQNTRLQIGLYVNARNMIDCTNNETCTSWFDFEKLNDITEYYIIGFEAFNPCNDLYKAGTVPLYNAQNGIYSLTTFANTLKNSKIAKDKIYLQFSVSPTINDTTTENLPSCCVTYQKYCENDHYNTFWCADNANALYQKGRFARDINVKGIVAKYIDAIDPATTCNCNNGDRFITLSMMLRGYLAQNPIKDCVKLNHIT